MIISSSWRKCCPESQILDMTLKQCVHDKYTSNKTYEYNFLAGKSSVLKQINPIFEGKFLRIISLCTIIIGMLLNESELFV